MKILNPFLSHTSHISSVQKHVDSDVTVRHDRAHAEHFHHGQNRNCPLERKRRQK